MAVAVTAEIARRAATSAWSDLPDDLVERTKQCLLDWFAVTVAGAQEELTDILVAEALEDGAKGPATLVGRSEKVLPSAAALINGAASHALDYDDVNFSMGGHPTVTVVPALLALGEQTQGLGPAVHRELRRRLRDLGPRRPARVAQPLPEGLPRHRHGRLLLGHRRRRPHAGPRRQAARRRLRHRRHAGRRPQVQLRHHVQAAACRHGLGARAARRPPRRQGLHRPRRFAGMRPGLRLLAERSPERRRRTRRAAVGLAPAQQSLQVPRRLLPDARAHRVRQGDPAEEQLPARAGEEDPAADRLGRRQGLQHPAIRRRASRPSSRCARPWPWR